MNAKPAKRPLEKTKPATKSTLTTVLCLKGPSQKQKKMSYKSKNKLMWSRQNIMKKMLLMSRFNCQSKEKKCHGFTCQPRKDYSGDWGKGKHLKQFKVLKLSTTKAYNSWHQIFAKNGHGGLSVLVHMNFKRCFNTILTSTILWNCMTRRHILEIKKYSSNSLTN